MKAGTKKCTKCGEVKPLEEFSSRSAAVDGKQGTCKACSKAADLVWRKANPRKALASAKAWKEANSERTKAITKAWKEANPEKIRAYQKADLGKARIRSDAYRKANPEKVRASIKAWRVANLEKARAKDRAHRKAYRKTYPEKVNAAVMARNARKLKACPAWADSAAIAKIYAEAGALSVSTGIKHNVDHWVPLRSKLVSGLHVEFNLRVITKAENLSKGNRTWPDMP